MQSLSHGKPQSTQSCVMQGLPLEQGGSASQAVTALAAEVRENVKLRQIRWCVSESRLHRLLGSADHCRVLGWLAPTSSLVHMPMVVLLVLLAESAAWWRLKQTARCFSSVWCVLRLCINPLTSPFRALCRCFSERWECAQ